MRGRSRIFVALGLAVPLLVCAVIFWRHYSLTSDRSVLWHNAPEVAETLEAEVAGLKGESLTDSLRNLSDVNAYYWPGPRFPSYIVGNPLPLSPDRCELALEAIMSNRRFRKVLAQLGRMDANAASEMVSKELFQTLEEYLSLYEAEFNRRAPYHTVEKSAGRPWTLGTTFTIATSREGESTILGLRNKVLALVWVSGILGLDNTDDIQAVTRHALKQRAELYGSTTLNAPFKIQMLVNASLYNRQILATALLSTATSRSADSPPFLLEEVGAEWQERVLTTYDALLTEYDLPVRQGFMRPKYSRRSPKVQFVTPLDDESFDVLLERSGLAGN